MVLGPCAPLEQKTATTLTLASVGNVNPQILRKSQKFKVPEKETKELIDIIASTRKDMVGK